MDTFAMWGGIARHDLEHGGDLRIVNYAERVLDLLDEIAALTESGSIELEQACSRAQRLELALVTLMEQCAALPAFASGERRKVLEKAFAAARGDQG